MLSPVPTTISPEYSFPSSFHRFYHLNAQFLQSSKQAVFQKGIFKVIKVSPPSEEAGPLQKSKPEELNTQKDIQARQADFIISSPSKLIYPINKQQKNSRRNFLNKDYLDKCILQLIKGKCLQIREDVR